MMPFLRAVVFSIFLLSALSLEAQDSDIIPKVAKYLESNGTINQYKDAYGQLLNLMEKQYPKSDKNGDGWLYLEKNKTKALAEIKDLLVPIYVKNFSEDEITEMYSFYTSDAGKQLVKDRTKLTAPQKKAADSFFTSKVGLKIQSKQQVLSQEISGVSEYWSKDLYQTAVLLLNEE